MTLFGNRRTGHPRSHSFMIAFVGLLVLLVVIPSGVLTWPAQTVKAGAPHDQITLTYWDDNTFGAYQKALDPIMQQFTTAYPNVKLKIVHGQNVQKLLTAIASGNAPDVFNLWDGSEPLGSLAAEGALLPLNDLMKASHFNVADQVPSAMQTVTYHHTIYGLPWVIGTLNYFYNMADFRAAGITKVPDTMSEMWADSKKLTVYNNSHRITRIGQIPPTSAWPVYTWVAAYGGSFYNMQTHQATPDNPGIIAALKDLAAQYKQYGTDTVDRFAASLGQAFTPNDPLFTGQAAMRLDGNWQGLNFKIYKPSMQFGRDWGEFKVPYPDGQPQRADATYLETNPMIIPAQTQHPQQAWDFVRYIDTGTPGLLSALANSSPPGSLTELRDPRIANLAYYQVTLHTLRTSPNIMIFPVLPNSQHYEDIFNADVALILHGKETPEAGMAHVKKIIQPELDAFFQAHPDQR